MPCSSDYMEPTPDEMYSGLHKELDRLTAENDRLREFLLHLKAGGSITADDWAWIRKEQTKHRKEDLARLEATFRANIADQKKKGWRGAATDQHTRLGLVITADPTMPLAPQLGFDPDSV